MSWSELFPAETERSLLDRAQHPKPLPEVQPSVWSQARTLVSAPYTGFAQGVNQTLRFGARVISAIPGGASEEIRSKNEAIGEAIDQQLRSGADYWMPDRMTSTFASNFLHEGSRILTKVAGYSMAGGLPGAVAGTSADEGVTQYLSLRDRGVDPTTAAKVGGVRAAATAVGVALPAAGATVAQTAALVGLSGPVAFVAEQAASRAILERAQYPDRAAEFDPWDPVGLIASVVPGAAVGTAVHAMRARRGVAAEPVAPPAVETHPPEMVDAAHVQYRQDVADSHALARPSDLEGRVSHARAVQEAQRALDEGRPMALGDVRVDEVRAAAVVNEMRERMELARRELGEDAPANRPPEGGMLALLEVEAVEVASARSIIAAMRAGDGAQTYVPGTRNLSEDPAAHNLAVGLMEAGRDSLRAERLLAEYTRRIASSDFQGRNRADIAADVVEELNGRLAPRVAEVSDQPTPMARAQRIANARPDLPVRVDENEPQGRRAADVISADRRAAQAELSESQKAFTAAIECVLSIGD